MISNIANGKYINKVSSEKCNEFGVWYEQYTSESTAFPPVEPNTAPKDTRLTFHPEYEIPQLKTWFKTCKTPSSEKLRSYANELNKGHVRQERPKVTPARLKIWWKNEKQKERKILRDRAVTLCEKSEEDSRSRSVMLFGLETLPDKGDLDPGDQRSLDFSADLPNIQSDVLPSCSFPDII